MASVYFVLRLEVIQQINAHKLFRAQRIVKMMIPRCYLGFNGLIKWCKESIFVLYRPSPKISPSLSRDTSMRTEERPRLISLLRSIDCSTEISFACQNLQFILRLNVSKLISFSKEYQPLQPPCHDRGLF